MLPVPPESIPALIALPAASAFQIDQTGRLTGFVDTNDNGVVSNNVPTAASLSAPDPTSGRGTAMFVTKGVLTHWVYYVTTANDLAFLSIDPITSPANLLQQTVLRQGLASFANSSLSGVSVLRSSGIAQSQDGRKKAPAAGAPEVVLGLLTTDGNGGGSVSIDQNDGGTLTQQQTSTRHLQCRRERTSDADRVWQQYSSRALPRQQNQAFLVGQDNTVASGYLEPQSGVALLDCLRDWRILGRLDHAGHCVGYGFGHRGLC